MEMSTIREQAMAYYWTLPPEQRDAAMGFFRALDTDGSGTISIEELTAFLSSQRIYSISYWKLFDELDMDKNGSLDFSEVITFFYIVIVNPAVFGIYPNQSNQQFLPAQYTSTADPTSTSTGPSIYEGNNSDGAAVAVTERGIRFHTAMQHAQNFSALYTIYEAANKFLCSIM